MIPAFLAATQVEPVGDDRFRAVVPDGWQQGRGAFGGLVLAMLLRAMERAEEDETRRPRALAGDLCGPLLPGEVELRVHRLRRGHHQTNLRAEAIQNGEVQALASAVLVGPRAISSAVLQPVPPMPSSGSTMDPLPMGHGIGPVFSRHFEYRAAGPSLGAGGGGREAAGFIQLREPLDALDAPAVVGFLDAWWPTLFELEPLCPVATISFVAEFLVDPRMVPAAAPLFHRARLEARRDAHFVEFRELWSGETLLAMNQQTFVILG